MAATNPRRRLPPARVWCPRIWKTFWAHPVRSRARPSLQFTLDAGQAQADAFDVRVSVPHLTPDPSSSHFAGNAPTATATGAPGAPGSVQNLTVTGLEQGQTVQLAVRVRRGGTWGPYSHGVGVRVPGPVMPPAPANAQALSAPGTISTPGYYVLTQDISAPGTAFNISAKGVTLDLAGFTITYGTNNSADVHGVYSEYQYFEGDTIIRNGTITQGGTGATAHCIHFRGGHNLRFTELNLTCNGSDTNPIMVYDQPSGHMRVDHCTINANVTTVVDRHFPGVAAIWLAAIVNSCEIDHNTIVASPQWGIKVQGNASTGPFWIHHNRVIGTRSRYANSYMIGVYKAGADVFENELRGESRGIHIDGEDNFGNGAEVHDNYVYAQDLPNPEFTPHWSHGIRIESASDCDVHHNNVLAVADATHSESFALAVSMGAGNNVLVRNNRFRAISTNPSFRSTAYSWVGGADTAPATTDIRHNVFQATDVAILRDWASTNGGPTRENVWLRDLSKGAANPFAFERIQISDIWPSSGHRLFNPLTGESLDAVDSWANPAAWSIERWFSVRVIAENTSGEPVGNAEVIIADRDGNETVATTDASGTAVLAIRASTASNGPAVTQHGPMVITVRRSGVGTYVGTHALSNRLALSVRLGPSSSAVEDVEPPTGPSTLWAHALSASRVRVRWDDAQDNTAVVGYLVQVDDEVAAKTSVPEAFLGGLTPSTTYAVCVRPIDAAGNVGPPIGPASVSTWAEDRGR